MERIWGLNVIGLDIAFLPQTFCYGRQSIRLLVNHFELHFKTCSSSGTRCRPLHRLDWIILTEKSSTVSESQPAQGPLASCYQYWVLVIHLLEKTQDHPGRLTHRRDICLLVLVLMHPYSKHQPLVHTYHPIIKFVVNSAIQKNNFFKKVAA